MENVARKQLEAEGWAWIPASSGIALDALLADLGPVMPSSLGGDHDAKALRPFSKESAPLRSMSSITGIDEQPMHTDAAYFPWPPHYLAFECVDPGETDCPTYVWALDWQRILHDRPDILTCPGWVARGGRHRPFYCEILRVELEDGGLVRFDPCCMTPPKSQGMLIGKAQNTLREYANSLQFTWKRGDVLLVDNWRCLHARGNAGSAPSRIIRRWMLEGSRGLVI
jgi:hypothetical protein